MSWLLQATGHVDREITSTREWAAIEDKLAAELHAVLSKPEYGTAHSVLGLRLVQGAIHKLDEPLPQGAPAPAGPTSDFVPADDFAKAAADQAAAAAAAQATKAAEDAAEAAKEQ